MKDKIADEMSWAELKIEFGRLQQENKRLKELLGYAKIQLENTYLSKNQKLIDKIEKALKE